MTVASSIRQETLLMRPQCAKQLCFLVGAPRSGTTWLQRLLQMHPKICGGAESSFFNFFARGLTEATKLARPGKVQTGPLVYIDEAAYEDMFRDMWSRVFQNLYETNPDAEVHLEKTPYHSFCLNEIIRLFPDAKIVVLLRDSRAVTSSLVHAGNGWGSYWAPKRYKDAAVMWYQYMRAIKKWRAQNPEHPCLVLRYEDAISDPADAVRQMLAFLELDHDDHTIARMMDAYREKDAKASDPAGFKRNRGATGWKKDMSLRAKLVTWRYTRKMMRELGYTCRPLG